MIPYGRQWIDEEDIKAVEEVLRSDLLTTGEKVPEFEKNFCEKTGAREACAVSNGTAALHTAAAILGIKEGDEVITTPLTFAASANCILYQGARPIFADIDEATWELSPRSVEEKITPKTKAIVAVDFTGAPCDFTELKKFGLPIIEDAAHSLGASYKGEKVGSISDLTTFSFHPVKHITTGEGGMITTNSPELAKKMRMFRSHGITRDKEELSEIRPQYYYEMKFLGYNYRLTDIQAALGISQLRRLDEFVARRRKIGDYYDEIFSDIPEITTQRFYHGAVSSRHLYCIRVSHKKKDRDRIFSELRDGGIGVNLHYLPVYLFPYYKSLGYEKGLCPVAERVSDELITLPLYPKLTDDEVEEVVRVVKKVMKG